MDLKNLRIGTLVTIKRSNGRMHNACISEIDTDKRIVSVEWTEGKDTKGKEVDLDQLFTLNPQLLLPHPSGNEPMSAKKEDRKTFFSPAPALPKPKSLAELNVSKPKVLDHPPRPISSQLSSKSQPQVSGSAAVTNLRPPPVANISSKPTERRKSNCVREVEKLKKNRDDRRAKAAEHLQQRFEDVDRSHPHWEFLKMIRDYRQGIDQDKYHYTPAATNDKICVCVRKRPLNKKELKRKDVDVITIPDGITSIVHEPKLKVDLTKYLENHDFRFDYAFDETVSNQTVYRCAAQPLVHSIFEQGMATCFAYGQTGSGKTHVSIINFILFV